LVSAQDIDQIAVLAPNFEQVLFDVLYDSVPQTILENLLVKLVGSAGHGQRE
jgi:hypothetical protein